MTTITFTEQMTVEHCCNCGIAFAMTDDFVDAAKRKKSTWYCPNGHAQHYLGKSDAQLRREAERDAANMAEEARIARAAANAAKRELAAVRKAAKTAETRAKAALCPVDGCGRSFVQLGRHMHAKHPDFVHEHAVGAP